MDLLMVYRNNQILEDKCNTKGELLFFLGQGEVRVRPKRQWKNASLNKSINACILEEYI